jgi:hypothetical protein
MADGRDGEPELGEEGGFPLEFSEGASGYTRQW